MQIRCSKCMKLFSDETKVCPFCGHVNVEPVEESLFLRAGTTVRERYIIGEVLGFGGFGATYVAWDIILERRVAIKEYFPSAFATRKPGQTSLSVFSGNKGECFRIGLKKYLSEARTMAKLESIPHIVGVKEYFEENNTAYIVMEFVDGITLKEHMKLNGTLSSKETVKLFLPLINSLSQVHSGNVIHRDISPDNIMVDKNGFKLIDFGAAREVFEDEEKSLSIVLKHGYAPEEQYYKRGRQGPWTDVYAMCATMYKCITGKTPPQVFERMAGVEIEPFSKLGISIAPHVERAIFKGMSIEAKDRFQSMTELYSALSTVETNTNFVRPEKKQEVASFSDAENESRKITPPTPSAEAPVGSASTGLDDIKPEAKAKNKSADKNKSVIIIGVVAAVLIVATVVTAIVLFGRAGGRNNVPTEPSAGEQTAAVGGTEAQSTDEPSTDDTTIDTSTEDSSLSESSTTTTTTTTKKIVAPNKRNNSYEMLYGSDGSTVIGVRLVIWGTYDRLDPNAEIFCNIDTHTCENQYSSFMGKTQNYSRTDEYYYTFILNDEFCGYSTSFTAFVDGESTDGIQGEEQHTDADIEYVYNDDCVEVYLYFPVHIEYDGCECGGKETLYVNFWVSENAFITPDGNGNSEWEYIRSYY